MSGIKVLQQLGEWQKIEDTSVFNEAVKQLTEENLLDRAID